MEPRVPPSADAHLTEIVKPMPDFHPRYEELIDEIFGRLQARYPQVHLRAIACVPPSSAQDKSMGSELDGVISFNAYWFGRHPSFLQSAAKTPPLFHGPMTDEPLHVFTHEFAHALAEGVTGLPERVKRLWEDATGDPESAPTEYALANPTEYFAELFSLCELGLAGESHRQQLRYAMGAGH